MNRTVFLMALLLIAMQATPQTPARVQTATRLVTIFSNLENQLWDALVRNDAAAAGRMLTDDFAQWSPEPPGSPIPRQQWLEQDRKDITGFRVRQMAAKDIGDHVIVNYVLTSKFPKAFFVVDVWKKAGADWQLESRYQTAVDATPYRHDARPTGKD